MNYTIEYYKDLNNKIIVVEWLASLKDHIARRMVLQRLLRVEQGNFGDHRFERDGVWELKISTGAGYRVYYSIENNQVVLLLCGGDKKSQTSDLDNAVDNLKTWRKGNEP